MTAVASAGTPFDFIGEDHFHEADDREHAMRLFSRSVSMVEIEVFSYCNRRCWFCPNAVVDRHSATEYMPEATYLDILRQLAGIGYTGMISYSRYNEPLADRIILRRLEQARHVLPDATLHSNTNGDYLTPEYLDELAMAGLKSLGIQVYLGNDERYNHERMRTKLDHLVRRLGLAVHLERDEPGTWLEVTVVHHDMRIRVYARNFDTNGCDRGGSVPIGHPARRTSPCLSPFYHLYIDFNGSIMPCCNLRSDVPAHSDAVIGTWSQQPDVFLTYAGEALASWRRHVIGFGPKSGHCATCTFVPFDASVANCTINDNLAALARRHGTELVPAAAAASGR